MFDPFRRATLIACALIAAGSMWAYFRLVRLRPTDALEYQKLLQESVELRSRRALEQNPAHQSRQGVQKEIWAVNGPERIHFRLNGASSELTLTQKKEKMDAKETLEEIRCTLEQKIGPHAMIEYLLSAREANYDGNQVVFSGKFQLEHPLGILKAEHATLKNIQLRGAEQKPELILEDQVSISALQGKTPFSIRADRARSELFPSHLFALYPLQEISFYDNVLIDLSESGSAKGGTAIYKTGSVTLYPSPPKTHCEILHGSDQTFAAELRFSLLNKELHGTTVHGTLAESPLHSPLHFSASHLFWEKKGLSRGKDTLRLAGEVRIEEPGQFSVYSDEASLSFHDASEPDLLFLEGNVRFFSREIQDKESFAIADAMTLSFDQQTLVLSANAPKRVLFWQEGLTLSAPEIHIRRDSVTKQESFEGKGDVRFTFDLAEKDLIDQLIGKYL